MDPMTEVLIPRSRITEADTYPRQVALDLADMADTLADELRKAAHGYEWDAQTASIFASELQRVARDLKSSAHPAETPTVALLSNRAYSPSLTDAGRKAIGR